MASLCESLGPSLKCIFWPAQASCPRKRIGRDKASSISCDSHLGWTHKRIPTMWPQWSNLSFFMWWPPQQSCGSEDYSMPLLLFGLLSPFTSFSSFCYLQWSLASCLRQFCIQGWWKKTMEGSIQHQHNSIPWSHSFQNFCSNQVL